MINARWKIRRLEAALTFRANAKNLDILEDHLERQQRIFLRSYRALRTHRGARNLPPQEQLSNLETGIPTNHNIDPPAGAGTRETAFRGRKVLVRTCLLITSLRKSSALPERSA